MADQSSSPRIFRRSFEYMPLNPLPPLPRSRLGIKIFIAACVLIILAVNLAPLKPVERVRALGHLGPAPVPANEPIPSIVHYVHIKRDGDSVLEFPFASFLALSASVMYIKPTQVYIHTDYNETEIERAGITGDRWTRAVINTFPNLLHWNPVHVPSFAGPNEDQRIDAIQHKSDFLRWETIEKIGGIYLDWDVFPLRPLTPLLNSGFAFIGGRHYGGAAEGGSINGTINNGAFLTKPNSTMARIVVREQHAGFNGKWESNLQSMTVIAEHLVTIPNEVLILDRNSFAPTHWFQDSAQGTDALFKPQPGHPSPEPVVVNTTDAMELYENVVLNRRRRAEWETDFSATYLLHAFGTSHHLEFISPKVILSRTSNFGLATYEVVRKMMADGLVSGEEGWEGFEKEGENEDEREDKKEGDNMDEKENGNEDEDEKEEATGLTHEHGSGVEPLPEGSEAVGPTKL